MHATEIVGWVGDAAVYHDDPACLGSRDTDEMDPIFAHEMESWNDDGSPPSCDTCLGYLWQDERVTESILSRDLLNLSEVYRREPVTKLVATCATIARQCDTSPTELRTHIIGALASADASSDPKLFLQVGQEIEKLTFAWIEKWTSRDIIHLQEDENGLYRMYCGLLGNEPDPENPGMWRGVWSEVPNEREDWREFDMRGYLDSLDSACESCGCLVTSHGYIEEFMGDVYCPACVTVD
jgi:hypothetical protein